MFNVPKFILLIGFLLMSPQNDRLNFNILKPYFARGPISYEPSDGRPPETNEKMYVMGQEVDVKETKKTIRMTRDTKGGQGAGGDYMEPNDETELSHYDMEATNENSARSIIKLFLFSDSTEPVVSCTGVIVEVDWVLTSAACVETATSDTYVKMCGNIIDSLIPDDCDGVFGKEIYFPRHEWYNAFAYVYAPNVSFMGNTSAMLPVPDKDVVHSGQLKKCVIQGYTNREIDEIADCIVTPRIVCRPGYFCFDDETGWACDINPGSPLICDGVLRGIYVGPHPLSCDNPYLDDISAIPVEEERNAVLLFINIAAYYHMHDRIVRKVFFAIED